MSAQPWNPIDNPVDTCKVDGVESPGYCEIIGASTKLNYDEIEAYGWNGGTVIFHGRPLSHFSIRLTLYTSEDWAQWALFEQVVQRPPAGLRPRAHSIDHPQLSARGIVSAVVGEIPTMVQTDHGVWVIDIPMIEWRAMRQAAVVKPDGADDGPPEDSVGAAKQRTIDELEHSVEALRGLAGAPP